MQAVTDGVYFSGTISYYCFRGRSNAESGDKHRVCLHVPENITSRFPYRLQGASRSDLHTFQRSLGFRMHNKLMVTAFRYPYTGRSNESALPDCPGGQRVNRDTDITEYDLYRCIFLYIL